MTVRRYQQRVIWDRLCGVCGAYYRIETLFPLVDHRVFCPVCHPRLPGFWQALALADVRAAADDEAEFEEHGGWAPL